ncbi:DUF2789 domain-containing protein [Xylophilus sp. GOD-11R]|uniref:DUF2789 domain-containing protein n=1 Tax=Xylophilus sp. GOD-11R TaxID=3089814 RepID=UPI00298D219D|nr:DUF2789 domain-containing protein [Xylophilus sp. GOD-11R]WPB56517.1 DUF2789 domain-containing protein [Xylophilus sp. GOD-11R]
MEPTTHQFYELFEQLGLPSDEASIEAFIDANTPLPEGVTMPEAPFWTENQRRFLREAVGADADWAMQVDQLNVALKG